MFQEEVGVVGGSAPAFQLKIPSLLLRREPGGVFSIVEIQSSEATKDVIAKLSHFCKYCLEMFSKNLKAEVHEKDCGKRLALTSRVGDPRDDEGLKNTFLIELGLQSLGNLSLMKENFGDVSADTKHEAFELPGSAKSQATCSKGRGWKRRRGGPRPSSRTLLRRFIKKHPMSLTSGLTFPHAHLQRMEREGEVVDYEMYCRTSGTSVQYAMTPGQLGHTTIYESQETKERISDDKEKEVGVDTISSAEVEGSPHLEDDKGKWIIPIITLD